MSTVIEKISMTTQQRPFPSFIKNSIPKDTFIPMSACHPVLTAESSPVMLPGTAFHLLMGVQKQPMVWGVYLSPTQWYVDGISRLRVISGDVTHFDFKAYPGSHIPQTKSPELWATMCISRIEDNKKLNKMVKNIDPRILEEIQRHCIPEPPPPPASQFFDVRPKIKCKYECRTCQRGFASSDGFKRHVCRREGEMFCCDFCAMEYTSLTWRDKHVATVHGGRTLQVQGQSQPERPHPITAPSPFRFEYYGTAVPPVEDDAPVPATVATVSEARRSMVFDSESEDDYNVIMNDGMTGLEILSIANTWELGQEFVMLFKERSDPIEYEAHGMLYRWEYGEGPPGPIVFYTQGKHHRPKYCEEALDCTANCVVLRLTAIEPTTKFDRKRRKLNR